MILRGIRRSTGYCPQWNMVIEFFLDDSGKESDPKHKYVTLAGYLACDEVWQDFCAKWKQKLFKHNLPYVHMREMKTLCPDPVRRKEIVSEFVEVIRVSDLNGIGCIVNADIWREMKKPQKAGFGSAQEFCFERTLRRFVDTLDLFAPTEHFALVYDQDFEFSGKRINLVKHLYAVEKRIKNRMASISFANSNIYYPLQAADILAWTLRKETSQRSEVAPFTGDWAELFKTLPDNNVSYECEMYEKEQIAALVEDLNKDPKAVERMKRIRNGEVVS